MERVKKSETEWREELSPEQYEVLRKKGTERAFTGAYWDTKEPGVYRCAACGHELFRSDTKFDSGTGWPSFFEPADDDAVGLHQARFQRAVNLQASAWPVPPPHRAIAERGLEHVCVVGQRDHQSAGGAAAQEIVEGAREREAFALLERQRDALLVARQLDHDLAVAMCELGEVKRF